MRPQEAALDMMGPGCQLRHQESHDFFYLQTNEWHVKFHGGHACEDSWFV